MRYIKEVNNSDFTIIVDDREKQPWDVGVVQVKRLKVGDYSIEGYEDVIAIEKKSGIGELFNDLAASYRETFKRFLRKMEAHPVSCIIVGEELNEYNIRRALSIIRKKSKGRCQLTEGTIHHWVGEIMMTYGIPILFLDWRVRDDILPNVFKAAYKKAREVK